MSQEVLANIWFVLLAVVWSVYIVQEMIVSGVGMISAMYLKDVKKFTYLNHLVGTHWDGIQVWLILAVGGTFAAFPEVFSKILTGLYIPIFLLLYIIIFRGTSIEVIEKTNNLKFKNILRKTWVISSFLLIVVLAIYLSNIFMGVPMDETGLNNSFFSFLFIFNMISIVCAIGFVLLSITLGSLFIILNNDEYKSELKYLKVLPLFAAFTIIMVLVGFNAKTDVFVSGIFVETNWLWILPIMVCVCSAIGGIALMFKKYWLGFILFLLAVILFVMTGYISLFPYFIYSTVDSSLSLTIIDGAANKSTLVVMFYSTLIFLPIVLFYQGYKYVKFWRS